jgi:hypothetical protein
MSDPARRWFLLALLAVAFPCPPAARAASLSGRVATANGLGVPAAIVEFLVPGSSVAIASGVTDAAGQYQAVLLDGVYDVRVTPPVESGFVAEVLPDRTLAGEFTLDLLLVSASAGRYSGHVTTASGTGVGDVQVIVEGFGVAATAVTDPSGAFTVVVPPGTYRRRLEYAPAGAPAAELPPEFSLALDGTVDVLGDTIETITLPPTVVLSGTVVDPGGTPVAGTRLRALFSNVLATGFTGTQGFDATAGADGGFAVAIFPSTVLLLAIPPAGIGLGSELVSLVATDTTSFAVVLPDTRYRALIETASGAPVSDALVVLESRVGLSESAVTDADGIAEIAVSPGSYQRQVSNASLPSSNPALPQAFHLLLPGTVDVVGDTDETIRLPGTVQLTGRILDPAGQPVAGATVASSLFTVLADDVVGEQGFETTTDGNGAFAVTVLPGMGSIEATPPPGSGLAMGSADVVVTADVTADIVLSDLVYSGHVRTATGSGVGDVSVDLYDGIRVAGASTDAAGAFSITVRPGIFERSLTYAPAAPAPDVPPAFTLRLDGTIDISADLIEELTLPEVFQLAGRIVAPNGQPVPDVAVTTSFFDVVAAGVNGTQEPSATTDPAGAFGVRVFPGFGSLLVTPPAASGLLPFALNGVAITTSDAELEVLLQLTGEAVTATVGPGGTVTTDGEGDGATPGDPIETAVTTPTGGTVSISESLMPLPAPEGFQFLAQQINIAAPPATPEVPLRIAFTIDASRVPVGETELTLQVFKNTVLVADCSGAPGTASPDPCVTLRERLPDGDVRLTVLTSTASPWNLGAAVAVGCVDDAECDDAVGCTSDACLDGTCTHVPQDGACSDGDACDGTERCDLDAGCLTGTPVTCPDDDDPCTTDVCDPATGACGLPATGPCDDGDACTAADHCAQGTCDGGPRRGCPDDGNPCTADVCDAATGRCGLPVESTCDDRDPCTAADRCEDGRCSGDGGSDPFAFAACEIGRVPGALCAPEGIDAVLAERLARRTARALDFLDAASGAASPERTTRAIEHVDRQLVVLRKRVNRAKPSRVPATCKAELKALLEAARGALEPLLER